MSIFLIVVSAFLILILGLIFMIIYIEVCQKSPCKMIREQGKCPFEGTVSCRECDYLDGNEKEQEGE